jgi:enterochelin esterase-like enzyme
MKPSSNILHLLVFIFLLSYSQPGSAQNMAQKKGTVERIKVFGNSLEGNLAGDSPGREVSIYLPPGYSSNPDRKYPVVYFLHGFTDSDAQWYGFEKHWINLPEVVNKAMAAGGLIEMIIVTPNAFTRFQGSFYTNSVTNGNWEDFVAKELVNHIDNNYRTIPHAGSRGIAGHSMGGYGAFRLGQKYPDTFSSMYLLSPCCLSITAESWNSLDALPDLEGIENQTQIDTAGFGTKVQFATAAAWAPNPDRPPFYLDLQKENGKLQPLVIAKRMANLGIATLDQNIFLIKKLRAIAFDAGDEDKEIAAGLRDLTLQLTRYQIPHEFEIYKGDHLNRIAERIENKMLKFFSKNLEAEAQ